MTFKRLQALYEGKGLVTYKGKKCEIVDISVKKQTAQVVEVDGMFQPIVEAKVEEPS